MNIQATLETFLHEYLNESDKKNIDRILISIESHSGHFFIIDSAKLMGLAEKSDKFQLAIYFSVNNRTKADKAILKRMEQSATFNDFKKFTDKNSAVFIANTNNNKEGIAQTIENIVKTTFPSFDISKIRIELIRIKEWINIQE
ncbi:MAG TPA: hypothetical protein VJU78_20245 [Chitinophagaceae bacterium]|nr:hypothetical protein [Chitinophagaceae bacterium]